MTETLPRPRLTLRVGITGHRLNKLQPQHLLGVRTALEQTFASIGASLLALHSDLAALPYSREPPELRLVSALAEGADRLAVEIRPAGWPLNVILPMPRGEYEQDFEGDGPDASSVSTFRDMLSRADTVTELPALTGTAGDIQARSRQYAELGHYLARQVDVLVAVWDGQAAAGPGGTASVIVNGLAQGLVVIWIRPDHPSDVRLLTGFSDLDITKPVATPFQIEGLQALLRPLLAYSPPAAHAPDHGHAHADPASHPTGVEPPSYISEHWPRPLRWTVAYPLLRKLSGAGRWSWPIGFSRPDQLLGGWDPFLGIAEGASSDGGSHRLDDLRRILLPRSNWADALASYHGHLYRSAYVTVFVLAGLSVPIGLTYLFWQDSPAILNIKAGFVVIELLIIAAVVTLVRRGTRRRWHQTWIETRELSELLRLSRPLACIGAMADLCGASSGEGRDSFAMWYVRASSREMRPVSGRLDSEYLRRILRATLETEIREQRGYHEGNAKNLRRIAHFLHHWGERCFGATMAVLAAYLVLWLADLVVSPSHAAEHAAAAATDHGVAEHAAAPHGGFHSLLHEVIKPLVSILAAGLPALGAALAGIGAQGGFSEQADRSTATRDQLVAIDAEIQTILETPNSDAPSLERTGDILLTAMRIMMQDVQAWRQAYVSKALTLPA